MAEDAAVENELLKVEYKAGILSFTSKPGGKTFVPKATFSQTV